MPTPILVILTITGVIILLGSVAAIISYARELHDEQNHQRPGWDEVETQQLQIWLHEDEKERRRCPRDQGGCGGTRCHDWRFNGRVCGDNPSTAGESDNLIGRHFEFSVRPVPAGWWPLPQTYLGRVRNDLWRKVADHCQISLAKPMGAIP